MPAGRTAQHVLARQYLEDTCRLLETLDPHDASARDVAERVWTSAVVEAERLGDGDLKVRLEDRALRILEHQTFADLDATLQQMRRNRLQWARGVGDRLAETLRETGIRVHEIQHRVKHTAGVWRKMREAELEIDQVHDLFAFRIVVASEPDCYLALAAVHRCYAPEPFRFKDYIAFPKANGYRSLHTTVRDAEDRLFEVQIRTREMHESAESGGAAHWRYRTERWGSLDRLRPRAPFYRRWFRSREPSGR
jgi:GTP pyrophosphokinase